MRTSGKWWGLTAVAVGVAVLLSAPVQAQETKYLPEETEVIFTINFKQIMNSKLVKDNQNLVDMLKKGLEAQMQKDADAAAAFKELGIDPFNDLDKMTVGAAGGKDMSKAVFVLSGNFDGQKIAATMAKIAEKHGDHIKIHGTGSSAVYEFIGKDGAKDSGFMALAGKKHILVTQNKDTLKAALAQGKAGGQPALKQEVKTLLANVNANQSLSFVATRAAIQKGMKESNNPQAKAIEPMIEQLEGVSASITVGTEIQFQANVQAKDAETAKEMAKNAQQGLVIANLMVQQQAQKNPQVAPLVDVVKSLRVTSQGNSVVATGRVPAEVIQQGLKMIPPINP